MLTFNENDNHKRGFIDCFCRDFNNIRVLPEFLDLNEVNPVLLTVDLAFLLVELKCEQGIKNIPLLANGQAIFCVWRCVSSNRIRD